MYNCICDPRSNFGYTQVKFKQNIIIDETFLLKELTLLLLTHLYNLKSFLLPVVEKNSNMFVSMPNFQSGINSDVFLKFYTRYFHFILEFVNLKNLFVL